MMRTTITSVGKQSQSVRTVIPMWVAKLMKLKKGEKLEWEIISDGDGFSAKFKVVEE